MNQGEVIGLPVQAPWVDVRSIGAGGGSLAEIDPGGLLRVGPRSAGANPGPACYGRGGTEATVTDAAFALGMLGEGHLAGGLELDSDPAETALSALGSTLNMDVQGVAEGGCASPRPTWPTRSARSRSSAGSTPRRGADGVRRGGGLFATLLARESEVPTIVIPPFTGNFSAWGLLGADVTQTTAQTMLAPLSTRAPGEAGGPGAAPRRAARAARRRREPRRRGRGP